MKKLNIGCGPDWKKNYPDYGGLDICDFGQKYVCDIFNYFNGILPEDQVKKLEYYDEVMANHFLEHFNQDEVKIIFQGVYKILKKGGLFKFIVPHKKKPKAWIPVHKSFWNEAGVEWLGEEIADSIYGFGKWKVKEIITNKKEDIHAWLIRK